MEARLAGSISGNGILIAALLSIEGLGGCFEPKLYQKNFLVSYLFQQEDVMHYIENDQIEVIMEEYS